jgi:thiol-disulfide isomerase/thioredoxin
MKVREEECMRMTARGAWEVLSTGIVVAAAVTMLFFYLRDRAQGGEHIESGLAYVEDWRDWDASAIRMGAEDAQMVVAAFMDFECPFCREMVPIFDSLTEEYGEKVAIEFHHFPLGGHTMAGPAAMAADCGYRQGRFEEMYHTLFAQMDSIGSKAWSGFAKDAGIPDISAFEACLRLPQGEFPRITAGRTLGARIGVTGTPKVWVNGELFHGRRLSDFRKKATELGL